MPCHLTVIAGPAQCGKTTRLLERYRRKLALSPPGAVLWLAPTWRAAAAVRDRLLTDDLPACFAPGVLTFERFAEVILQGSGATIRPITRRMKRALIRQLLDELAAAGRVKYFHPIVATRGLVDLVGELISDLKRLEIWPDDFGRNRPAGPAHPPLSATGRDAELAELYALYQQALREHGLYDAEGRFWSARDWLSKQCDPAGSPAVALALRFVAVDGFADFTRTQHEILELLAARVEQMWISLPLDPTPGRAELFDKSLRTLAELRRRHPRLEVEELARPQRPVWPAMAHVEQRLFGNPRQVESATETVGLEILVAASPLGEAEMIAGRIKRLLADGQARPDEIAVVLRTPLEPGSRLAEVFAQCGIPVALETGSTLERAAGLRALLALLQLIADDWPLPALRALLRNNYFSPDWPEFTAGRAVAEIERALAQLQVSGGRQAILDALLWQAERPQVGDRDAEQSLSEQSGSAEANVPESRTDTAATAAHAAAVTLGILRRLAAACDTLPQQATLAGWARAWQDFAAQLGLRRVMCFPAGSATVAAGDEAPAWDRFQAAVAETATLDHWLGRHSPELDLVQALGQLQDILAAERIPPGGDEAGCVRVLSAPSVRGLQFPYLFVAGLAEKAFPLPESEGRLYNDAELRRLTEQLIGAGLPLVAHADRTHDEMLLFYETVTRATRRLYLSYPALDPAAQPLSPSPYLQEVQAACGTTAIARTAPPDLRPLPAGDEPLSTAQYRLMAVSRGLAGRPEWLAALDATVGENLLAALELIDARGGREAFGPAEGMLFGPAAQHAVARRFGGDRTFTATELESYAACPYRFLVERVLQIAPIETVALAEDRLERGRWIHDALALLHQRVNQQQGRPASPVALDEADYAALADEVLDATAAMPAGPVQAALAQVDRRVLRGWLRDYRQQFSDYAGLWSKYDQPPLPEFFEAGFGKGRSVGPLQAAEPLTVGTADEPVRISGRIDRIDTGRHGRHALFTVIDYKIGASGKFSDEMLAAGTSLQLPIYALAVCELLLADRDALPLAAGYWRLSDGGFKPRKALKMYEIGAEAAGPTDDWESQRMKLDATVSALVRGLRGGVFPVYNADVHCTGRCPLKTVCRINHIRALEKQWHPNPPSA